MCRSLCEFHPDAVSHGKGKRRRVSSVCDFPSPSELAGVDIELLNSHCKLGYRAELIIDLAKKVCNGSVKLNTLEDENKLRKRLMKIKGVGPFTCASIMMCIGFYQYIPIDTETKRHIREVASYVRIFNHQYVYIYILFSLQLFCTKDTWNNKMQPSINGEDLWKVCTISEPGILVSKADILKKLFHMTEAFNVIHLSGWSFWKLMRKGWENYQN